MPYVANDKYNDVFVEAQTNVVTVDPYGNRFTIWSGQQFKFIGYNMILTGCGSCGGGSFIREYLINAYAHCCDGEYIWPDGPTIKVLEGQFVETESLKLPPVTTDMADELSGVNTDLFTPPWKRKVPREGGVWYVDPWEPYVR